MLSTLVQVKCGCPSLRAVAKRAERQPLRCNALSGNMNRNVGGKVSP